MGYIVVKSIAIADRTYCEIQTVIVNGKEEKAEVCD
jgi:hypothetical protein